VVAALTDVIGFLDAELRRAEIPDYPGAMNGLQLANRGEVRHVAGAVDYSTRVVTEAVQAKVDLLILHHGMYWTEVTPIIGTSFERLSALMANDVAVYGSHLPLDLHPRFGNNPLLARELGLTPSGGFAMMRGVAIGVSGDADIPTGQLVERAESFCDRFGRPLIVTPVRAGQVTRRWGICTGAGASTESLREAAQLGLDTIIVGEGPHHTAVQAGDLGITVLYAGHYATETLGVAAIAEEVARQFGIRWSFIDAPTIL
jgi:dinuclear metal center YbgI/SA1388 family protein